MFNFLKRKKESNFEGLSMADMQQGCTIYMNYHDGIGISTSHFYYPPTFTNPMRPEIIKKTLNHFIKWTSFRLFVNRTSENISGTNNNTY